MSLWCGISGKGLSLMVRKSDSSTYVDHLSETAVVAVLWCGVSRRKGLVLGCSSYRLAGCGTSVITLFVFVCAVKVL